MDANIWKYLPRDVVRHILWRSEARKVACLSKFWKELATMKTQKEIIIEQLNLIVAAFGNPVRKEDGSFGLAEKFWDILDAEVSRAWVKIRNTKLLDVYIIKADTGVGVFQEILREYEVFFSPDCLMYPRGQRPIVIEEALVNGDDDDKLLGSVFLKGLVEKLKPAGPCVPIGVIIIVLSGLAILWKKKKKEI